VSQFLRQVVRLIRIALLEGVAIPDTVPAELVENLAHIR